MKDYCRVDPATEKLACDFASFNEGVGYFVTTAGCILLGLVLLFLVFRLLGLLLWDRPVRRRDLVMHMRGAIKESYYLREDIHDAVSEVTTRKNSPPPGPRR